MPELIISEIDIEGFSIYVLSKNIYLKQLFINKIRDAGQMASVPCLGGGKQLTRSHIYIAIKLFISLIRMAKLYKSGYTIDTMHSFLLDNRTFVLYND